MTHLNIREFCARYSHLDGGIAACPCFIAEDFEVEVPGFEHRPEWFSSEP